MPEHVHSSRADAVRTIVIDRPDVHNAFNETVIRELTEAFRAAGEDPETRVVVLASTGKSFSAGADIHWMQRMVGYSLQENVADATDMANMLRAIRECPRPVVARVHGACFGGGVGLVAACDIAIAVRGAVFALTEVKLGILPAVISPFVAERIGVGQMRRYALTAERFGADVAERIGLIAEVVETEADLDAEIHAFVKQLRANGPEAIAHCKAVLRDIHPVDWDAATALTTRRIAERRVSAEGQEGLHAFLEKRFAAWVPNDS